jgi:DNA-binding response OmpR family regulator
MDIGGSPPGAIQSLRDDDARAAASFPIPHDNFLTTGPRNAQAVSHRPAALPGPGRRPIVRAVRLLVVEDYQPLRDSLVNGLRHEGYAVDAAATGDEGWWHLNDTDYDAVILDVMLPVLDGMAILRRMREHGRDTPVLLLTAQDSVEQRVAGLDAGADDYLAKPFAVPELLARLRSVIRRRHGRSRNAMAVADLVLDPATRSARRAGRELDLTPREWQLLLYLAAHSGRVVGRDELWQHLYDFEAEAGSNVIDALIARVRRKLHGDGASPLLHTIRGHGYRLEGEP